ncbi:VOC family protein [Candidatus Babeliales bacterium]|nr:VOC family protein [Candidatus Babeliales bacterium]
MEHGPIKLGMVIFMQPDLEKAVEFYKKFGFKLNFHLKDRWAEFDLGCVKLGLCPVENAQDNVRTGVVFEIMQDLVAFHAQMKEQGIEFINEPIVAPHGVMLGVKDSGGNVFDLYQPTPEKVKEIIEQTKEEQGKNE